MRSDVRRAEPGPPGGPYYVYAVVRSPGRVEAGTLPCAGVGGAPVSTLAHRDLAAVVSPVPAEDFGPEALPAKLQDARWVGATALAHHRVVAWLLGRYTVGPLKFGTLCREAEHARELVAGHYRQLDDALSRVDGASEWDVKLYCDRNALAEFLVRARPEMRRMVGEAAAMPEGTAYLLRKRAELYARQEVDPLVVSHGQDVQQQLAHVARAAVANDARPWETHPGSPEVIFHSAYLVANDDREAFHAAAAALRQTSEPMGFSLVLTGPWPAYSFVQLTLEDPP